ARPAQMLQIGNNMSYNRHNSSISNIDSIGKMLSMGSLQSRRLQVQSDIFRKEIQKHFRRALERGAGYVDINSGETHRAIGGYPGRDHRMPVCCEVMYTEMRAGDRIIHQPPKGKGASLTIRYALPR
ncbi:hypothetical protein AB4144_51835, partial [Rhizobiaceae sp. 2RAB30]